MVGCTIILKRSINIPQPPPLPESIEIRHIAIRVLDGKKRKPRWQSKIKQYTNNVHYENLTYEIHVSDLEILSISNGIQTYCPKKAGKVFDGLCALKTFSSPSPSPVNSLDGTLYETAYKYLEVCGKENLKGGIKSLPEHFGEYFRK